MKQKLINHVFLVVDASGSMSGWSPDVKILINEQITNLSKNKDQENRISLYTFCGGGVYSGDIPLDIKCQYFDVNVDNVPDFKYKAFGGTPLYDAIGTAVKDAKSSISTRYGDHAFLFIILTDGQENTSVTYRKDELKSVVKDANDTDNYTLSILVPDSSSKWRMKDLGFEMGNITVWDSTSKKGYTEASSRILCGTRNFVEERLAGIKKSAKFFQVDLDKLSSTDVRKAAKQLAPGKDFDLFWVPTNIQPKTWISTFVEKTTGKDYKLKSSFYELVKPEKIQPEKEIILFNKTSGFYFGGKYARQLAKLPDYEVKVSPGDYGDWEIYVQSTSINRHISPGTSLIVMR